ncbi:MAG: hypothetical protein CVV44_22100 [Spirochaetae bacterium HGW-Spirochaetae-1]|jgi:AcrR family transcriptional regulator|nr:MAG: hypothetical protein CVV44_22100 [Spirochaetae bacterium HGW-Spirochaetae-1]
MMVKKEDKIQKKKKIIIDALKVRLRNDVYSKITVQDIADEAGFSKGGVLHYFATKEDIYLSLIEDIFNEFDVAHRQILQMGLEADSMAPMSALVGVENFILDKTNIRIIINLILYAFEDEKILKILKTYISRLRIFYDNIIINDRKSVPTRRRSDLDVKYLSRIVQTIVIFIGILESIDPIELDHVEIVKYVTSLLKA